MNMATAAPYGTDSNPKHSDSDTPSTRNRAAVAFCKTACGRQTGNGQQSTRNKPPNLCCMGSRTKNGLCEVDTVEWADWWTDGLVNTKALVLFTACAGGRLVGRHHAGCCIPYEERLVTAGYDQLQAI